MVYLQLFIVFFKIGILGFGGGYGMISLIQFEIVESHGWLSMQALSDIIAISQATPGPIGINSATFVGYSVAGVGGALLATFAVVLPSFILMFILIKVFNRYSDTVYTKTIMQVMQYVVIGMLAASVVLLVNEDTFGEGYTDYVAWATLVVSFIAIRYFKINPLLLICIGGVFGLVFL